MTQERPSSAWRLLVKEGLSFALVGGLCTLLDIGLFQLLYAHVGLDAVVSRLVSSLVSVTVSYFAHRYWSFGHRETTGATREYTIFALVNGFAVLLSLGAVWFVRYPLGQESAIVLQIANIGSIAVGTITRFLVYRKWVFTTAPAPAAEDRPVVPAQRVHRSFHHAA